MRKLLTVLAAVAASALMATTSANAAARWSCEGADYVCGSSSSSTAKPTYKDASDEAAPRKARRVKQDVATSSNDDDQPVRRKARRAHVAATSNDDEAPAPRRRARHQYSDEGGSTLSGMASYYWEPQALASGGRFNPNAMTAAHKTLPFGTRVLVTNQRNGASVEVVINDRGPYVGGRIIDLSKAAAQAISMTGAGVAPVSVRVLGRS